MWFVYKFLALFFKLAKWLFILIFLITLIGISAHYFEDMSNFRYLNYVLNIDQQITAFVHQYFPTHFMGKDIARLITLIISFIGFTLMRHISETFDYKSLVVKMRKDSTRLKKLPATKEGEQKFVILDEKVEQMKTASRQDRKKLLDEFVEIKRQLESMGRNMAFLAIDVVDSTKMKAGEDPIVVSYDFEKYRELVETNLNAHGVVKSAWTPDGLMACFNSLDEALKAGKGVISALPHFNRSVKGMKQNFQVRCGINAGYLLFDESLPLEQISDRAIDIAGHMQKSAHPNTILMPKNLVMPIAKPESLSDTSTTVDDLEVCEWKSNTTKNT